MSLFDFGRLFYRNLKYIIPVPLVLAFMVFILTMNQAKEYAVSSLIYTGIASGFNLESGASDKVDYHAVNNAFDNLISVIQSRQTKEEVMLKLMTKHLEMIDSLGSKAIPQAYTESLKPVREMLSTTSFDQKHELYLSIEQQPEHYPEILRLINATTGPYSIKALGSLEAKRHRSSDMIVLYYKSENPTVAKLTLELIIEIFTDRYKNLKKAETGDVVSYFEKQLALAKEKLNDAEDKLTVFRTGSQVINYGEQTKAIAIKKQNALEEYSRIKMNLKASEVALKQIEEKLAIRESLLSANTDLLDKRNQLAQLTRQLARVERSDSISQSARFELRDQIEVHKNDIKKDLEMIYSYSNSKEGLPSQQLLNEWLQTLIELNRGQANADFYQERLKELNTLYDRFAPLGSTLARLEREISVSEREYLEILYGLNMARLRQQNIEMSTSLEVVDWPKYPTVPVKSKRKLLVIASFMFGLVTVLSILVAGVLLDNSLKTPLHAHKITGLRILGALPDLNHKLLTTSSHLKSRIVNSMVSRILQQENNRIIAIGSAQHHEGKTTIAALIREQLEKKGILVRMVTPHEDLENSITYDPNSEVNNEFSTRKLDIQDHERIIIELPAHCDGNTPIAALKESDLLILVALAARSWTPAHEKMIEDWQSITPHKPHMVLNGIKHYHLDQVIGELPTQRLGFVDKLRRVLKLELGNVSFKS